MESANQRQIKKKWRLQVEDDKEAHIEFTCQSFTKSKMVARAHGKQKPAQYKLSRVGGQ